MELNLADGELIWDTILHLVLFNTLISALDAGLECTIIKFADSDNLEVVGTLSRERRPCREIWFDWCIGL